PLTATLAPAARNASTMARPIPRVPPVTRIRLPAKSSFMATPCCITREDHSSTIAWARSPGGNHPHRRPFLTKGGRGSQRKQPGNDASRPPLFDRLTRTEAEGYRPPEEGSAEQPVRGPAQAAEEPARERARRRLRRLLFAVFGLLVIAAAIGYG